MAKKEIKAFLWKTIDAHCIYDDDLSFKNVQTSQGSTFYLFFLNLDIIILYELIF